MSKAYHSTEDAIRCCADYRAGKSVKSISNEYGIPRSTVYYWINKYKDIPDVYDITLKKSFDNMRRKYEKSQQMCEVLKLVNCTQSSPMKEKLYELEQLYGQYSTHVLCEALDVPRGTFYNHILRNKKQNNVYQKHRAEIADAVRDVYDESNGLFGSDKILSVLQSRGYHTSKKMVRELMKEMGLRSFRYRAKRDFASWKKLHETKNVLQQDFSVDAPNTAWVSDCTQFTLCERKYYLCAVLDLFSRKIIAYRISPKAST